MRMNHQDWENLLCDYFYTICLRVLSTYFSDFGFSSVKNKIGGVTFRNHDIFVEVSYEPENYPNHTLSIVVGIGKEAYDECGRFTGIPVWSIIPKDATESGLLVRTFSEEVELSDLLFEIQVSVLEAYIKPLWTDKSKLEKEVKRFLAG